MKIIKKIQPKKNEDIDFDALAQRIRQEKKEAEITPTLIDSTLADNVDSMTTPVNKTPKKATKAEKPVKELKKAGRKKTNTEEIHRFAIDLPLWLFEQIRKDADDNFSTVRGQILKLLLSHYKNVS